MENHLRRERGVEAESRLRVYEAGVVDRVKLISVRNPDHPDTSESNKLVLRADVSRWGARQMPPGARHYALGGLLRAGNAWSCAEGADRVW